MHNPQNNSTFNKSAILEILLNGTIDLQGQFTLGSNYTFLVGLQHPAGSLRAIYKPLKGEVPLWDFAPESLAGREIAAYLVSEALGWGLVPPTVMRNAGPFGPGSLQLFIPHDSELNYFSFSRPLRLKLKPVALFDLLINNADRKGSHVILGDDQQLWLIDHGLCFHAHPKLRTVIWDFADKPIPKKLIGDLAVLLEKLDTDPGFRKELSSWISSAEIAALKSRILNIIKQPVFPKPDTEKRQFPWPPV